MKNLLSTRRRKALVTFLAVGASALAGLVWAAWLTDGEGEGRARVGNLVAPTVSPGSTAPASACFAGGTCAGSFTINNTNPASLTITGVSEPIGAATGTGTLDCPISNLTANPQTGLSIPAPEGSSQITVPNAYRLKADAPTGCQGVTMTRKVRLTFSTQTTP